LGLSDVRIMVTAMGGGTVMTVTGANGAYSLTGLLPGMYRVEETDPKWYYSFSSNNVVVLVDANKVTTVNFADHPATRTMIPLVLRE
jgi:hypothetical protein